MILFNKFTLANGLRVLHHHDETTGLCAVNLLYDVGSKDERDDKTGFAHLFEHLMFGGSVNIPDYDAALQLACGENNAFTNNDFTNYYITLPSQNIETAFWLESDRMLSLAFSNKSLDVQKNVVQEEFKERYLNQPYGDVWLNLLPLVYKKHPYRWPTIGQSLKHIQDAQLDDVKEFFFSYYSPNNCILSVAGNISLEQCKSLTEKWFGDIPFRERPKRTYPTEPKQLSPRKQTIASDVPLGLIVKAYPMCHRMDDLYYSADMLSDILGSGKSSYLYQKLVKESKLFTEFDVYLSGDIEPGLFVFEGKTANNVTIEEADNALSFEITTLLENIKEKDLERAKNKTETTICFNDMGVLNKAMKLGYCELLGDASLCNSELEKYGLVTIESINRFYHTFITPENTNTLHYLPR